MNRNELCKTLELLKPALAKDPRIPIFQCFCFDEGRVSAYDDEIAATGPADCGASFGVHGTVLLNLLNSHSADNIELKVSKDSVEVKAGKSVMTLPAFPKDNFLFKTPDVQGTAVPYTESLHQALTLCLETVSHDETQRALMGITVQGNRMYSCNGDVLTRVELKTNFKTRLMLPTAFCHMVAKVWSNEEMTKGTLTYNGEWLHASFEDWDIYSRVPEVNQTLDFESEIKKGFKSAIEQVEVPAGFVEALGRARVLADIESARTNVVIAKGTLSLSTSTHMGDVNDSLSLKHHPDLKCAIHAAHVANALKRCDSIAFYENCVVLERKPDVFILVSNL